MSSSLDLAVCRQRIQNLCSREAATFIADRRDFHRFAETGWTEFRTAARIASRLSELGWRVRVGSEVVCREERMGVPDELTLERCWHRAREQGADVQILDEMRGGLTGVVAEFGDAKSPVVAARFDIDALELQESAALEHRPVREGFASVNQGISHACGHDGHAAIGLGIARVLTALGEVLPGTVRLIFQPAEEGVRGAKSMVSAGVVEGVRDLLGLHLYSGWPLGHLVGGKGGFLATSKFDARIIGSAAHAAGSPHLGKNALLAAATAVLNLYAIPPHREGITRINVGRLAAGGARNAICSQAHLAIETRGQTSSLNAYVYELAVRVLDSAARMYGCDLELLPMGQAESADSDPELAMRVVEIAAELGGYIAREPEPGGGSEDFTYMMRQVQAQGGLATSIGLGADLGRWGHHTPEFDFDERALALAVQLLAAVIIDLLSHPTSGR